jgi:aspartate aminotransferase-like enzyme
MTFNPQLRIPGPTPLPERVVRAMSRPMVDHRGSEFAAALQEVTEGAKRVFKTGSDVLLLTASGSGGLESAIANLVSPGDEVVAVIIGNFGERFAAIAEAYGCSLVKLEYEWGQPASPEDLRATLAAHPNARIVLLTHNETSTSVTNPLKELAAVVREAGRLAVVDGVSSISSIPIETDAWGIDVAVSGSQKGWMAPPGIALVAVGERAWEQQARARAPRFYFDWKSARDFYAKGATPFTPAVSVVFAMQEGLRMLEEEGLDNVYARHRRLADATAAGLEAIGFQLFAAEGYRSATVTGALPPAGLDVSAFRKRLNQKYGVIIAGGQGKMTGKMIRVGHLGAVTEGDIVQVLWAIEQVLEELDVAPAEGKALAAAGGVLSREGHLAVTA